MSEAQATLEYRRPECEKRWHNGACAIQTPVEHRQSSGAPSGQISALMRLMACVLACALLLLPSSFGAPLASAGDWQGKQTVVRDASLVLSLSSYDRGQSALRSADPQHSGKTSGGTGKAMLDAGAPLRVPEQGRATASLHHDVLPPVEKFAAFSARAPPFGA